MTKILGQSSAKETMNIEELIYKELKKDQSALSKRLLHSLSGKSTGLAGGELKRNLSRVLSKKFFNGDPN